MKTYEEIYQNVIEATDAHRQKVRKMQYTASASAVFLTCVLGVGMFMKLERPDSLPSESNTTTTTTMTTDEVTKIIDTIASAPACSDTEEPPTTIYYRIPGGLSRETTAEPVETELSMTYSDESNSTSAVSTDTEGAFLQTEAETDVLTEQESPVHDVAPVTAPEKPVSSSVSPAPETIPKVPSSTTMTTVSPPKATTSLESDQEVPPDFFQTETATEPIPDVTEPEVPDEPIEPSSSADSPETTVSVAPTEPLSPDIVSPSETEAPQEEPTEITEEVTETEPEAEDIYLTPAEWRELFGDAEYRLVQRDAYIEVTWTTITTVEEYIEYSEEIEDCSEIS